MTRSNAHPVAWWLMLCLFVLPNMHAGAGDDAPLSGAELVEALRNGGHVVYFRHEATDWSQDDQVGDKHDVGSCDPAQMRQLSEAGRESARRTGEAIRALRIPVGAVLASPYCRAVDTAARMGLGEVRTTADVMNLRAAQLFGGRGAIVARARALLATPPAAGTNVVVVAHGNVAREATGVYPGEGEGVAFEPQGGGEFRFVGRLTPAQWRALARDALER